MFKTNNFHEIWAFCYNDYVDTSFLGHVAMWPHNLFGGSETWDKPAAYIFGMGNRSSTWIRHKKAQELGQEEQEDWLFSHKKLNNRSS
jgi:hypothetical protein